MYFLNYKKKSIFRLYNFIKKKVIRVNNIYFMKKRFLFLNFEKKIEIYEFFYKRQRFIIVLIFAIKKILKK